MHWHGWRERLIASASFVAIMMIALGTSDRAAAGMGTSCAAPDVLFELDAPGTAIKASLGFNNDTAPEPDIIQAVWIGTDGNGDSFGGSSGCGGSSWERATVLLGGQSDRLRLDARKPLVSGANKIPRFIEVVAFGGDGSDTFIGHRGADRFRAGAGADLIKVEDGDAADKAACGTGRDKAVIDRHDRASGCERIIRR